MSTTSRNIMLGTAGHVDHGKTALVKLLTGCETDTLAVEKQRGLTIELGFAPCRMADKRIVGIVDVPGHVSFIRNMVAGAHGVDVVILVVAADDGVMPQTREHLDILTLMGVRHGLVALTKIDLVDDELREMAVEDVHRFVAGTFLEDAAVTPISNITGEGFDGFFAALDEAVERCRSRPVSGLFRLWVERTFSVRGFGQVVSGIPTNGQVTVGDRLRLLPGSHAVRVRGLEVYGNAAEVGRAGECVALNVADVDSQSIARGNVLCGHETAELVSVGEAELQLLRHARRALPNHAEVHLHVGTSHVMAKVAMLDRQQLTPGESALVQLRLASALPIAPGDRFVVRTGTSQAAQQGLMTVGGGQVLGISNARSRRRRDRMLASLDARKQAIGDPLTWCDLHLSEAGCALNVRTLAERVAMPLAEVDAIVTELKATGSVIDADDGLFAHANTVANLGQRVMTVLMEFHTSHPMRLGMKPDELARRLELSGGLLGPAIRQLVDAGAVVLKGLLVTAVDHKPQLAEEDVELCGRIESALQEANLAAPSPAKLADGLGISRERLDMLVSSLADQGSLVVVDVDMVMHREAAESAKQVAIDLLARNGGFSTAEYRDALGVSRKYVIPLLDYFDRIRLTVRLGSRRTPGALAKRTDNV